MAQPIGIQAERELARRRFAQFVEYVRPGYDMQAFHEKICNVLQLVERGELKRVIINMPPQHGKSELVSRLFAPWVLGRNESKKIALVSYSAGMASSFNRDMQRVIDLPRYAHCFPGVVLGDKTGRATIARTTETFETTLGGFVKTVGRGGGLTGTAVDLLIADDTLKDFSEAHSPVVLSGLWEWWRSVCETRLHNDSAVVVVSTRWSDNDLPGKLMDRDPDDWYVVKFPAINDAGHALWPERHSLERLEKIREDSPATFNALYQQDPKPDQQTLVIPVWHEIDSLPEGNVIAGLDWGFGNDPAAVVRVVIQGRNVYVDELVYGTGLTNSDLCARIESLRRVPIYCDSAEPKSIEDLRRAGFRPLAAVKGPGSVQSSVRLLQGYNLHVTKRSRNLIHEFNRLQWVPDTDSYTGPDHAFDALRYCVYSQRVGSMRAASV